MERTYRSNFEKVYNAAKRALKELDINIEYQDREKGIIEASTGTSLFSWGEDIQIRISQRNGDVHVKVKSTSQAQFIDWGRNEKNEENILKEITTILRQK